MRILLVHPPYPVAYWGFQHTLKFVGKKAIFPPLGLMTVSALLPPEWERKLIDQNVGDELTDEHIASADMVFVTGMLIQKHAMRKIVRRAKNQGKRVVVGGPYISTSTLDIPDADHIFVGEAEATLPQFIKDLERGEAKRIYKATEYPELTSTPQPDFSLVDTSKYNTMSVQFSRGCPFDCEFCDITKIYGRRPRPKSNPQFLAELDALLDRGWNSSVFIVDDNFIGNLPRVRKLVPDLIQWQKRNYYPFSFYTEASVNLAEEDKLLADMREANFTKFFLGIESPNEASLLETHKQQNTRRALSESVKKIQGYGFEVMGGFIVGFDSDPLDIFEQQIDFIRGSAIPLAMVGTLAALPDTDLYIRLEKEGRLLGESDGNNTGNGEINFVPKMDSRLIVEGHRKIVKTIYSSKEYYQRVLDLFDRMPPVFRPESTELSLAKRLEILSRIVLRLGIIEPDRREFWRYMRRVVRGHQDRFAHAMRLAIAGYHCRVISNEL